MSFFSLYSNLSHIFYRQQQNKLSKQTILCCRIKQSKKRFSSIIHFMPKENMSLDDSIDNPPDTLDHGHTTVNNFATKKTLAIGNLEIALIVTNAVQLKTLLGHKTDKDSLWWIGLALVCASLIIQLLNAGILVLLGTDDISKKARQHRLISLNNFSLILSVLVTAINVILNIIVAIDPQILSQATNGTKRL